MFVLEIGIGCFLRSEPYDCFSVIDLAEEMLDCFGRERLHQVAPYFHSRIICSARQSPDSNAWLSIMLWM
jgi:hypothetical protein